MVKHCLEYLTFLHPHPTLPPSKKNKGNLCFNTILNFELWLAYEVSLGNINKKFIFIMFISSQYYFRDKYIGWNDWNNYQW